MNSLLRLFVFLIPISVCAAEPEKVDRQQSQNTVIMEDVIVERTIVRTTKQNPKQEENYDNDRDFMKNAIKMLPMILTNLLMFR